MTDSPRCADPKNAIFMFFFFWSTTDPTRWGWPGNSLTGEPNPSGGGGGGLEWPYTIAGGGCHQSDHCGKNEISNRKIWLGHFWYTNFWVPKIPFACERGLH